MSMYKAKINNKIYDVVNNLEEYFNNIEVYQNSSVALKEGDYIYPIFNTKIDQYNPGIYINKNNCFYRYVEPISENQDLYTNKNLIDFESKSMSEFIEKSEKLKEMEKNILLSPNNIFTPSISEKDKPEMKALKKSIISKHIDLDKYKSRFGSNYSNDKRLLNDNSITVRKLISVANALDIKATLILQDKNPNVPNPMNNIIKVELTNE